MKTGGLAVDQSPPLTIPLSFYALVAVSLSVAGVLLAGQGDVLLLTPWLPQTIAWTHALTLGVLAAAMFGSLYQMVPVVAGTPVPVVGLAYGVAALLAGGLAALVTGLAMGVQPLIVVAAAALALALAGFVVPLAVALVRAPGGGMTRTGMRGALVCLAGLGLLGVRLAWAHGTGAWPDDRRAWLVAHVTLALLGWVGSLTTAVSWQVVPMFYLTAHFPPRTSAPLAWLVPASALLTASLALAGAPHVAVLATALPAALSVWLLHPVQVANLLRNRRRRRTDPSLHFWWLALACAPLALIAAVLTATTDWQPAPLLFGWLAITGWAGALVHGMLTRIVPFLSWFHAFAAAAGRANVPPMKQLLTDREVAWNAYAHVATVVLGVAAIVLQLDLLARLTGLGLAVTGILLGRALVQTVRRSHPDRLSPDTPARQT